jgi:uncharacterized protein
MKTVAVLGASTHRAKFGNKAVRAYAAQGFTVWPINARADVIEGRTAYASISALPGRPDIVSVYLPPEILLPLLPEIQARGCDELWLNPGTDSPAVVGAAEALGLPVIRACSVLGIGRSPSEFAD